MAANPPSPPPAPSPPPPPPPARSLKQKVLEAVMLFLPKQFEVAWNRGLLWVLAALIFTVFIAPPVVVLLAAFSLKMLERPGWDITDKIRQSYVSYIYSGFDIDRRSGSVEHIDYFQAIDFVAPPKEPTSVTINLVPRQKARISFSTIKLVPRTPKCALQPERKGEVMVLRLQGIEVRRFAEYEDQSEPKEVVFNEDFWKKHLKDEDSSQRSFVLEFIPTDAVQKQCAYLAVKGSVTVFKDVYKEKVGSR